MAIESQHPSAVVGPPVAQPVPRRWIGAGGGHRIRCLGPPVQRPPTDRHPFEAMLQRMFLGDPPGNDDRILGYSTAVTGTLFFVPTADFLDDPPPHPNGAG